MSRLGLYQEIAKRHGTVLEAASPGMRPQLGGGITKRPLADAVAASLVKELRNVGAEARLVSLNIDAFALNTDAFVYLSGCSFVKEDKL